MGIEGIDLVQVIKDNPGCCAVVDNDCWVLYRESPWNNPHEEGDASAYDAWEKSNELAQDTTIKPVGDGGYGYGCREGRDLLYALAQIVGMRLERA